MGTPISEKKRKLIIADYAARKNYSEVARMHGISANGVKKIVQRDPKCAELCEQKEIENTQSVLEYMDSQSARKKSLLDKLLMAMEDKTDNLDMFTNIKDLATAYGILTDKEIKLAELGIMGVHRKKDSEIDPLSASLMEMAGELDGD